MPPQLDSGLSTQRNVYLERNAYDPYPPMSGHPTHIVWSAGTSHIGIFNLEEFGSQAAIKLCVLNVPSLYLRRNAVGFDFGTSMD